jgi:hypothetical protein
MQKNRQREGQKQDYVNNSKNIWQKMTNKDENKMQKEITGEVKNKNTKN